MAVIDQDLHYPPPQKHWAKTLIKWSLIFAFIVFVIFTAMSRMGGNNDTLKGAIENYLTEATGYHTSIHKLNNMSFFPNINFDFEGAELRSDIMQDIPDITIDSVKVTMGFWDTMSGSGRFKDVQIEGMRTASNALIDKPLNVARMGIMKADDGQPKFMAVGYVGEQEALVEMDMKNEGSQYKPVFEFGENRTFTLRIGKAGVSGKMQNADDKSLALANARLSYDGENVATGDLVLTRNAWNEMAVNGALVVNEHGTKLSPDLVVKGLNGNPDISGRIMRTALDERDFEKDARLAQLVDYLYPIFSDDGAGLALDILNTIRGFDEEPSCDVLDVQITKGSLASLKQSNAGEGC